MELLGQRAGRSDLLQGALEGGQLRQGSGQPTVIQGDLPVPGDGLAGQTQVAGDGPIQLSGLQPA